MADQNSSTFRLLTEGGLVVQDDVRISPPAMPELIDKYGAYAQMLAAVLEDGEMVGLIAVHQLEEPRHWTDEEIGKLTSAAEEAGRELPTTG
jgi:GAF domain-containing protein